ELILVDDGSSDTSWQVICQLSLKYLEVRGVRFRRNFGKSAAIAAGVADCNGSIVVLIDADLQDRPEELRPMLQTLRDKRLDMVVGWRRRRNDPACKQLASAMFNGLVNRFSGISLHDHNCGMKVVTR